MKKVICFSLFCLLLSGVVGAQEKVGVHLSLLDQNGAAISFVSDSVRVDKLGNMLQVKAQDGANSLEMNVPQYVFDNGSNKHYANNASHIFYPTETVVLNLTIGPVKYSTIYRYRPAGKYIAQLTTSDYTLETSNDPATKKAYFIRLNVGKNSFLRASSDTTAAAALPTLYFADGSSVVAKNPEPFPFVPSGKLIDKAFVDPE